MINIVVCMKIIIDPETPLSIFKIDKENKRALPPSGTPPVMSTFDENALEAALRIKDSHECKIIILSMGKKLPKAVLQKSLAAGADDVIALEDPEFDNLDPFTSAYILANAIKKIENFNLIFTGRQSADWDAGIVWAGISDMLDIPAVTIAQKTEIQSNKLVVERCVSDGIEVIETDMPALVTFSNEAGELRSTSLKALMSVRKKEFIKWTSEDMAFTKTDFMNPMDLFEPELNEIDCFYVGGEKEVEKGRKLAIKLLDEVINL